MPILVAAIDGYAKPNVSNGNAGWIVELWRAADLWLFQPIATFGYLDLDPVQVRYFEKVR